MSPRPMVTALTTTLAATMVTAAVGQGPRVAPPLGQDARMAAVARLQVGQRVRVEERSSERMIGTFQRSGDGMLLLESDGVERSLPIADMTGLWVRGSSWKTGSAVGALLLAAAGALVAGGACVAAEEEHTTRCAIAGGLAGALAGGLLGGAIGAAIPKWHRHYP